MANLNNIQDNYIKNNPNENNHTNNDYTNIFAGVRIIGSFLYLSKVKVLVIGDTHLGYEEALNKEGVMIPRFHLKEIFLALNDVFSKVKPKIVVLLGDVKHEFGSISSQEWKDTLLLIDYLSSKAKLVIIKGNHDVLLESVVKKQKIEIKENFCVSDFIFCHGDKLIDEKSSEFIKAKTIIIGHEHPAISIRDGSRTEKYKCFLAGTYKKKNLIVVPSINLLVEGTDVIQQNLLSPFIKNILDFRIFVVADKTYDFGLLKEIINFNKF